MANSNDVVPWLQASRSEIEVCLFLSFTYPARLASPPTSSLALLSRFHAHSLYVPIRFQIRSAYSGFIFAIE